MLKKEKVLKDLTNLAPNIFSAKSKEIEIVLQFWEEIYPELNLNLKIPVNKNILNYFVSSVDGSQIYPDRHQGISCYLLNTGQVQFFYGKNSWVKFDSEPNIFFNNTTEFTDSELIDCKRGEIELKSGLDIMLSFKKNLDKNNLINNNLDFNSLNLENQQDLPALFLIDGSIIFWHLQSKPEEQKTKFLGKYLGILDQFYKNNILFAGFISLPKSKDIVNLFKNILEKKEINNTKNSNINNFNFIVDSDILSIFLEENYRTDIILSDADICKYYPSYLKPCFFYINFEKEIVRVEIPNFIAQNLENLNKIIEIITDQVYKGKGFPVCLSEAHEQAVVKTADREFFYNLLAKITQEQGQKYIISQKSLKKRFVNI